MKNLSTRIVLAALFAIPGAGWAAVDFATSDYLNYRASWTYSGTGSGLVIPDNSASGVAFGLNFGAGLDAGVIDTMSVSFTISGGWNGDLYAYLTHTDPSANGYQVILLNRVGWTTGNPDGSAGSGFTSFVMSSAGTTDIHTYAATPGQPVTGNTFLPDGRDFDPRNPNQTTAPTLRFDVLNGADPHGTWTLFFADLGPGWTGELQNWSVDVRMDSVVPEPVNVALMIFGGLGAGVWGVRRWRAKRSGASS